MSDVHTKRYCHQEYPNMLVITNSGGFPVGVDTDNILSVNSMPRSRRISEVLQKTGHVEKSGQGIDRMFAISISEGMPIPDYSLTDEWQVCLRLPGEIKYPTFMLYARELQNARPANNKLNVFDLLALFRASQGESQRYTDEVTLRKLIDEGLLIPAQDGYKLPERYYEIVKKTTVNVTGQKDDTINVQLLDTNKLTERQTVIYNSIKEGVQLNVQLNTTDLSNKLSIGFKTMQRELKVIENLGLIVRVGSKKTGHWEVINKG